jgi:hypothetical protein
MLKILKIRENSRPGPVNQYTNVRHFVLSNSVPENETESFKTQGMRLSK